MDSRETTKAIFQKFHIHRGDNLPFTGVVSTDRTVLAELFCELGFTKGAEIGVRAGENAGTLLKRNPNLHLILVDPWTPFHQCTQEKQDAYYKRCLQTMEPYANRIEIKKMTSLDAIREVPDESLDFVYIDGMHLFDFVMIDIIEWSKKVSSGGIVSGHDYYHAYAQGVVRAVDAYTLAHNITNWFITGERYPSYFWVK